MNFGTENQFSEFEGARFLIISGNYDLFGGAERQALILAKELHENFGCHVDFLGWRGDGILAQKVRNLGLTPRVFPLSKSQNRFEKAISLYLLARFIKREIRPDYLLPFIGYHSKIIGLIWRFTGAKFTWWNQRDEGRKVYGSRVERWLMKSLPSIVSNSFEGRDFLIEKFNLPSERVAVINSGVVIPETHPRSEWREKLCIGSDDIVITMIANLTKYKDHDTLLRAFAIARKSPIGNRCKLVLAGRQGETAKDLKALAYDLKLGESVEMVGVVDPIDSLLSDTDLVIHSSVTEGCPNAVLEAMAYQKPVIGTDISGMRQALGEKAAAKYLAPARDYAQLANLIIRLASDPAERTRVGIENWERVEAEFSTSKLAREVLRTIAENRVQSGPGLFS